MRNEKVLRPSRFVYTCLKILCLCFANDEYRIIPSMPQDTTSPIPTINIINGIASGNPYAYRSIIGIIIALDRIGGNGARNLFCLRSRYVKNAPIRVARLPNTMSRRTAPPRIFPIRQPINNPGMAAGVNAGRIVSASAMRTWPTLKLIGANISVRIT